MKKFICLLITMVLILTSFPATGLANGINVYIDGVPVAFNNSTGYPFSWSGRTYVPLRATMESFGATVEWDTATQTAFVRKGTTTVRCIVGDYVIYRNNVKIANDAAATTSGGRVYLPIRAVLEAFGATVAWNGNVIVTSPGDDSMIYNIENGTYSTTNYWPVWNNAIAQKNAGNYTSAITKILSISSIFIKKNQSSSNAMLYKHLGECYANLKDYSKASACFKREAYYWSITSGQEESRRDAARRSNLISTGTQVYVKNQDFYMGGRTYFGIPHEPAGGIYLGAYAEGDSILHDPYSMSKFYMDTYPYTAGKDMAAYLLYLPYGTSINHYASHIAKAIEKNKILQIALEPHNGLYNVNDYTGYITKLAYDMQNSGCRMMLRFAGEMNDTTSSWYNADPSLFIEKFRLVSSIFHTYAPSVPVIWAPNFYPADTISKYYPGDEYVDYVGISSYMMHQPVTDPLGAGVDRSRWSNQLDTIYSLYGHKKPIIIVEGGASYMDYETWRDITPFAAYQIKDFYTYLPIKYPNVKMCFNFAYNRDRQKFAITTNYQYQQGYMQGINSSDLLKGDVAADSYTYDYYEVGNNVAIKAEQTELCSYITTPSNDVAYVNYYINDIYLGTAYGAPYSVPVNFIGYNGQRVKITVNSYDANNMPLTTYSIYANIV